MASWLSSWLPGIPSINLSLPTNLQSRVVSFALKRSLGHLLKPGQLEAQQIDSQLGSGTVQISKLELDRDAINVMLAGLPLQLESGSIASISATLSTMNPLSANMHCAVRSFHLTFQLVEPSSVNQAPGPDSLADSLAPLAESFLREEPVAPEVFNLRDPIDLDNGGYPEPTIPGGMDPFMTNPDDQPGVNTEGLSMMENILEVLLSRIQLDVTDAQITFVHPGNARFTLCVPEIKYHTQLRESTDTHNLGDARTVTISGLKVLTSSLRPPPPPPVMASPSTASPISPRSSSSLHSAATADHIPPSAEPLYSPSISDSEMDEETAMMMSQSLAFLPPRPSSPSTTTAESMYMSAISEHSSEDDNVKPSEGSQHPAGSGGRSIPSPREAIDTSDAATSTTVSEEDEILLSLAMEPLVVQLTRIVAITPSSSGGDSRQTESTGVPTSPSVTVEEPKRQAVSAQINRPTQKFKLSISMGAISAAFDAKQIGSILGVTALLTAGSTNPPAKSLGGKPASSTSLLTGLEASLRLRAAVVLMLPSSIGDLPSSEREALRIFHERPLIPPRLPCSFLRLFIDTVVVSLSNTDPQASRLPQSKTATAMASTFSVSISDISVLAFLKHDHDPQAQSLVSPLLISDPHLVSQYASDHIFPPKPDHGIRGTQPPRRDVMAPEHPRMPSFEVKDWTTDRTSASKLSAWRTRAPHLPRREKVSATTEGAAAGQAGRDDVDADESHPPIVEVAIKLSSTESPVGDEKSMKNDVRIHVRLMPLHAFVDFGLGLGTENAVTTFINNITASVPSSASSRTGHTMDDDTEPETQMDELATPPTTPRARARELDPEQERKRLEQLVLDDLDLGYDYRQPATPTQQRTRAATGNTRKRRKTTTSASPIDITIIAPALRVQVRCPPPEGKPPRSGALVLDIRGLQIHSGPVPDSPVKPKFSVDDPGVNTRNPLATKHARHRLGSAQVEHIVLSVALLGENRASAVLSLGPVPTESNAQQLVSVEPSQPSDTLLGIDISQSEPSDKTSSAVSTLVVAVTIPSIYVCSTKACADGLQLLADDVTQVLERTFAAEASRDEIRSRDTSMIGSRFFARAGGSGSRSASTTTSLSTGAIASTVPRSETVVKINITQAAARLIFPHEDSVEKGLPFDAFASQIDVLLELKPEGKDRTVLTMDLDDLQLFEVLENGESRVHLSFLGEHKAASVRSPLIKLRFISLIVPETTAKESRIQMTVTGFLYDLFSDLKWSQRLAVFFKAPPGAFESVVPNERTRVNIKLINGAVRVFGKDRPGAVALSIGELVFASDMSGDNPQHSLRLAIPQMSALLVDDQFAVNNVESLLSGSPTAASRWKSAGYALLGELEDLDMTIDIAKDVSLPSTKLGIEGMTMRLHFCADTGTALSAFLADLSFGDDKSTTTSLPPSAKRLPTVVTEVAAEQDPLSLSLDDYAFRLRLPEVGPAPDMVDDDLPSNMDYLDDSFSASAGLREWSDDDLADSDAESSLARTDLLPTVGGETIKMLHPEGLRIVEHYFDNLPPDAAAADNNFGDTSLRVRARRCDVTVFLYDGYDWVYTRKTIEDETKAMRRRLAKLRQLLASGQGYDPKAEETSTLLFNSVYVGLDQDADNMEAGSIIAAIDRELEDDTATTLEDSWQTLPPQLPSSPEQKPHRNRTKRLTRSRGPSIEFRLSGGNVELDNLRPGAELVSRTLVTIRDAEILDHVKTSTWRTFLTELRTDSFGNIRETGSNMVRVELRNVKPVLSDTSVETRLRAKLLPLRLHVDQDALDFMKKFFSFKDPKSAPASQARDATETYFQHVEVFPVGIKMDYKPRRVDYRALREGRTIELMNFFHFDGAEMTLRHITLSGVTGWARLGDLLNDLWTPDVKATQLMDVISGVAPIRSVINVGSGVADLVLLPIAQYKKDGRIVRGVQKGTTAFMKSAGMEALKLGARLATGTQVILEQAENVLGGQFKNPVTAEAMQSALQDDLDAGNLKVLGEDVDQHELFSRYAEQPMDVKEGIQSAYQSLRTNINSAAQTILAVPMEVYERSGSEGSVRAVVRAVPIAVLKPMIGATEAVSKTLLGLHNTFDPNVRQDNEAKYKQSR